MRVHDCRKTGWGHTIEAQWGQDDQCKVQGCLTPLPTVGDYVIAASGLVLRFTEVKPMGNPRDGFFGRVEPTRATLEEGCDAPTMEEIETFLAGVTSGS